MFAWRVCPCAIIFGSFKRHAVGVAESPSHVQVNSRTRTQGAVGHVAAIAQKTLVGVLAFCCLMAFSTNTTKGDILTLEANHTFSGTAPAGTLPWLTAVFDDQANPGYVTLTLTATSLQPGESVDQWYLNIDPAIVPSDLGFTLLTKTGSLADPVVSAGSDDAYKAGSDGYYDVEFQFDHTGHADRRFNGGESVTYLISGVSAASSFDVPSSPGPGQSPGPFKMAAHIQMGNGTSAWVAPAAAAAPTVPEPSSLILLGLSAAGLLFFLRRRTAV
jgi:hypothetical protein